MDVGYVRTARTLNFAVFDPYMRHWAADMRENISAAIVRHYETKASR
jgi:hypothetical protein